jgi:hypothetical protein
MAGDRCVPTWEDGAMDATPCEVPAGSLLAELRDARSAFADAYTLTLPRSVRLPAFVEAFYTTPLFKKERWILARIGKPSTDEDAARVARGEQQDFAVWKQHARREDELVMMEGTTCSWFCARPVNGGTQLWFGSAVFPRRRHADGRPQFGFLFNALLGFHVWYSKALLRAAARALTAA